MLKSKIFKKANSVSLLVKHKILWGADIIGPNREKDQTPHVLYVSGGWGDHLECKINKNWEREKKRG